MPLPLLMLVVFGAAKLLAEVMENLGQPAIVGEILAGVLVGPAVLGWVPADGAVTSFGELGVMFLLFRVGLEVDPARLWKIGRTAALVAVCGVVASLGLAWVVLAAAGIRGAEALFVAAALAATSAGIAAQVLSARGLLSERASEVILAAAVIDDICGLLVLSVVSGFTGGNKPGLAGIAVTVVLSTGFVVMVARWGAGLMQRVIPQAGGRLRLAEAEFALALYLLFGLAALSARTGISAIVGAFLAGMALSGSVGTRVRTLVHGAAELLVPFFLVGIGLRLNLVALRSGPMLLLALGLFVAAMAAKVLGCGLGALSMGRVTAWRVGAGMIPRGEVTMVVAQMGLAAGVVSQGVFGAVVAVAIATTLAGPPLIRMAFSQHEGGTSGKL